MYAALLVLVPAVAGGACFLLRWSTMSRLLLVAGAGAHAALTTLAWRAHPSGGASNWLGLDPLGLLFLSVTSVLFLAVAVYAAGFLAREGQGERTDPEEGILFRNYPHGSFAGCLLLMLSSISLVATSRQFGLLWVAVEATTLVSATLIHYHRHHRSLEATWKYLLICSVGIALALLGNFFLAAAAAGSGVEEGTGLTFAGLLSHARELDPGWLRAAAVLFVVGYGTKMGLVPMHTWLPDAHSEAPSAVSALLSGGLLNCAFLAILRVQELLVAAGLGVFGRDMMLGLGFVTMAGAAVFIISQKDYKRLLAYSSVENMGILAVGVGLGGRGDWGALYHAVNHSLIKGALFLTAGNILLAYRTKRVDETQGVLRRLPGSGVLWLAGLVAISGIPPFGSFLSELAILGEAVSGGRWGAAAVFLVLILVAVAGLVVSFSRMAQGGLPAGTVRTRESLVTLAPPLVLLAAAAVLGTVVPGFLDTLIAGGAAGLAVNP